tara:strand:+ start:136994 stop:138244 length:1251 start_codon:yes stop_codon:yes gene_type:complete
MRILLVTQYFWPESFIINQLAKLLVEQGHQIVVLTGKPNYPEGKIFTGYKKEYVLKEQMGDVEVMRIPLRPRKSGNAKDLVLNYLSFVFSGLFRFPWLIKGRKFDVVFVFAPSPITSAIPAIFLKYIKRTHLVIWVQDLWPESLSATGFVRNKLVLKIVRYMVKVIYACSDTLLVPSIAFIKPVSALSNTEKIKYYPNSTEDMQALKAGDRNSEIPESLKELLTENFCLVFAGNIGSAQSIDTLISAAQRLTAISDIRIVLVGEGSLLAWAKEEVRRRELKNVIFTGSFPNSLMPAIFSRSEALLVSLKAEEIFSYTIPSKVQAYMSSGRPIIATINGEAARVIDEAGAGLTCPAQDVEALVVTIGQFYNMKPLEREKLGQQGRKYFLENFEMKQQSKRLIEILEQRIAQKKVKKK